MLTRNLQGLMIVLNSGMPGKNNSTTAKDILGGSVNDLTSSNSYISRLTGERFRATEGEDIGRSI
jgi:hypothetical protein